jgi:hypothetical protein
MFEIRLKNLKALKGRRKIASARLNQPHREYLTKSMRVV